MLRAPLTAIRGVAARKLIAAALLGPVAAVLVAAKCGSNAESADVTEVVVPLGTIVPLSGDSRLPEPARVLLQEADRELKARNFDGAAAAAKRARKEANSAVASAPVPGPSVPSTAVTPAPQIPPPQDDDAPQVIQPPPPRQDDGPPPQDDGQLSEREYQFIMRLTDVIEGIAEVNLGNDRAGVQALERSECATDAVPEEPALQNLKITCLSALSVGHRRTGDNDAAEGALAEALVVAPENNADVLVRRFCGAAQTGTSERCAKLPPTPTATQPAPTAVPTATEPAPTPTATEPAPTAEPTPTATEPEPTPTATEQEPTAARAPTATQPKKTTARTPTATQPKKTTARTSAAAGTADRRQPPSTPSRRSDDP